MKNGNIPVFQVQGRTLPEVWEKSVLLTWKTGIPIETEYDREGDPPSKDCTMIMVVEEPFAEPRIHRALPVGLEELEIYRLEVLEGIHDDRIGSFGWSYSYHDRLFVYRVGEVVVDQITSIVEKLSRAQYSRRAQGITWKVFEDLQRDDPPCLQRVWCRLLPNRGGFVLNLNTHWRSRDAYKAAFMNMWVFTALQEMIAVRLAQALDKRVEVGRYVDISDSYHIYGSYFADFEKFLRRVCETEFKDRVWTTEFAESDFAEARKSVESKSK